MKTLIRRGRDLDFVSVSVPIRGGGHTSRLSTSFTGTAGRLTSAYDPHEEESSPLWIEGLAAPFNVPTRPHDIYEIRPVHSPLPSRGKMGGGALKCRPMFAPGCFGRAIPHCPGKNLCLERGHGGALLAVVGNSNKLAQEVGGMLSVSCAADGIRFKASLIPNESNLSLFESIKLGHIGCSILWETLRCSWATDEENPHVPLCVVESANVYHIALLTNPAFPTWCRPMK